MLATIREKIQGWFATVILLIIGIPFALWGINSYFEGDADPIVARVDDTEIGIQAYRNALERQRQSMRQFLGANLDPRMLDNPAFKTQVVNSMVDETLVAQYARRHGYAISDAQLARAIHEIPQFRNEEKFDAKRYEETLRSAGMSVAGFEQSLREDALAQQTRGGYLQAIVTQADVEAEVRLDTEKREFSYTVFAPSALMAQMNVPDDLVQNYYTSHIDQFKTPEQVRIAYVRLSADALARNVSVSDADIQKQYEDEAARLTTPEQRKASHILIPVAAGAKPEEAERALAEAQSLRKQIAGGADFATLARKHSKDPVSAAKGGDLGFAARGAYVKEFEAALFGLKANEVSQPVKTQYGYHIIKVTAIKPEVRKPLAQVRAELERNVRQRKAEERFYELSQTLQNVVYENPDSLQPAAAALGLKVEESDWFARKGGAGIAANPKISEAAFQTEVLSQQRNSDVIELAPTDMLALRVLARRESTVRPLGEVRPQIVAAVKQELAQSEASKRGEALQAKVSSGAALADGKATGAQAVQTKTVSRSDLGGVDQRLATAVFRAPAPQAGKPSSGGVDLGVGGYAVFVVTRVTEGHSGDANLQARARQTLERRYGEEMYQALLASLRKTTPIKIYEERL